MRRILVTPTPIYIGTLGEARVWADYYWNQPVIAVDTETTGLNLIRDRVKFFSLADETTRVCGPVRVLHVFKDLLESAHSLKLLANRNYDWNLLLNEGIHLTQNCRDVVHADWYLDENREGRHGLKDLAADYLHMQMAPFSDVFGSVRGKGEEVKTLVEMHDILESSDDLLAELLLIRVGRIGSDDPTLDETRRRRIADAYGTILSMFRDNVFPIPDITKALRSSGVTEQVGGKFGYGVEAMRFMNRATAAEPNKTVFDRFLQCSKDPAFSEELAMLALETLRKLVHIRNLPIPMSALEFIRLQVTDYASLDAWATYKVWQALSYRMERDQQ